MYRKNRIFKVQLNNFDETGNFSYRNLNILIFSSEKSATSQVKKGKYENSIVKFNSYLNFKINNLNI